MSKQTINIGASPNDGTGTPLRTSFDYTNQNFTELYTALGGGVGLPGATTQVIFNDGGTNLAGDAGLVYNKTTDTLTAGNATITGAATVGTTLGVTGDLSAAANSILGTGSKATDTLLDFKADTGTQRIYLDRGGRNLIFKDVTTNIENYRITGVTGVHTWGVGGTTAMTLNSTGLGIGVVPSAWGTYKALQVTNASLWGAVNNAYVGANYYFDGTNRKYIANGFASEYSQVSGAHAWFTAVSGTAAANITFTQAMTLEASGNLLVASGVIRAAGRTEIGSGYIGDISGTGNNTGIFFGSLGLLPANGSGTTSDNTYDLGSATARWDTVFAGTGTINTSDRNEKQDISDLSASEKRVASSIKQLVKKYRFKDAVASKGENARIHVGWIAQDIQSAFAAEGLDASNYGMFCSDTWEENGVEKTRLGLRYDEVLAFVVSAI